MTRTVKLCAEALTSNAQGDFVTGVAGVTMTLLRNGAQVEASPTNDAGVVEFAEKVTPGTMGQYSVQAALQPAVRYQFRGQPDQDIERGALFQKTGKAYVHKITFRLEPRDWIGVRVVDRAGAILSGVRVRVTRPDRTASVFTLARARLRDDGSHRLMGVPPGTYKISLVDLDQDLWATTGAPGPDPAHAQRPPVEVGRRHDVVAGDCLWSVAVRYGVPKDGIWNARGNEGLRDRYPNGDTLLAGQTLILPAVRVKDEDCDSGLCHDFVVNDVPRTMRVVFVDRGEPAAAAIAGRVAIAGHPDTDVQTDGDGAIEFPVPATATEAVVSMPGLGLETYTLKLGHLDPVEAPSGVLQRLTNLGYYQAPQPPGADAERAALVAAVRSFQRSRAIDLEDPALDGTVGRATMDALVDWGGA